MIHGGGVMGKRNIKNQVDRALKKINKIGESKKSLRDDKKETGIHSTTQVKHAYSTSMQFVKWAKKERGLKDIYKLKRSHYRDYISYKADQDVSKDHLINIETNLRLLFKGMNEFSKDQGFRERDWVPKERLIQSSERSPGRDRSYSRDEVHKIRENLPEGSKTAIDLQNAFGLRLREVTNMKVAHIVEKDGRIYFQASENKNALNSAKGVTKAGRGRITPCLPQYEQRVREIASGKEDDQFLSSKYNTVKSAYNRAAQKAEISNYTGSHGFRHSFARERLESYLKDNSILDKGKSMIDRMVQNYDNGNRKDTGVSQVERGLYKEVNRCIDQVHGELGHGKGRIDLVAVYMR